MTAEVVTVTPTTRLVDARRTMDEKQIRDLPVMIGPQLVGIVTRRDLLRVDPSSSLAAKRWQSHFDLENLTVGNVMTTSVITIDEDAPAPKAARVMLENKITALPVLDDQRALIGVITSSDVFRLLLKLLDAGATDCLVKDLMTTEPVTIPPETALIDAHRLMGVKDIRTLLVTHGSKLIGIVTITDLLAADPSRLISQDEQALARQIEDEKIERFMTRDPITIDETQSIGDAARSMLTHKFHSLPVKNAGGDLVGVITESDIFKWIMQMYLA
jgi:CBS domain-containing protein